MKFRFKRAVLSGWASLAAAFVALLPQFYLLYDEGNRYTLGWSARTRASILIAIAVLGLVFWMGYWFLHWGAAVARTRTKKINWKAWAFAITSWGFMALLFRTLMAIAFQTEQLPDAVLWWIDTPWNKLLWYGVVPAALLFFQRRFFERIARFLFGLSCILLLFWTVQSLQWPLYVDDAPQRIFPSLSPKKENPPGSLYIFLFDEWSYADSFGHPDFSLDHMPNLKQLLTEAILFRDAYSPAVSSGVSIPRFLYQPDPRLQEMSFGEVTRALRHNQLLSMNMKSIFDLSPRPFKLVVGTYLHYTLILGNKVDRILRFDDASSHYSLMMRVRDYLWTQLSFLHRLGVPRPDQVKSPLQAAGWVDLSNEFQSQIRPVLQDVLPRLPFPSMAFFHMYLPHPPYIFLRDWTPRVEPCSPDTNPWLYYIENVYAVDVVIGDIVTILKERGDYDSSMIVILSDHPWKHRYGNDGKIWAALDPGKRIPEKHVPLIIKYPGQRRGGEWTNTFYTADLFPALVEFWNEPNNVAHEISRWNSGEVDLPLLLPSINNQEP